MSPKHLTKGNSKDLQKLASIELHRRQLTKHLAGIELKRRKIMQKLDALDALKRRLRR